MTYFIFRGDLFFTKTESIDMLKLFPASQGYCVVCSIAGY